MKVKRDTYLKQLVDSIWNVHMGVIACVRL